MMVYNFSVLQACIQPQADFALSLGNEIEDMRIADIRNTRICQ